MALLNKWYVVGPADVYVIKEQTAEPTEYSPGVPAEKVVLLGTVRTAIEMASPNLTKYSMSVVDGGDLDCEGGCGCHYSILGSKNTVDPDKDNDITEGHPVGCKWMNTVNGCQFVCVDNTDGAAIWKFLTPVPYVVNLRSGDFILVHDANFAPVETLTGTNISRYAHSFDYATQEYVRHELTVPGDVDPNGNIKITFKWIPRVAPSPSQDVVWEVEGNGAVDGGDWDVALSSIDTLISPSPAAGDIRIDTLTISVTAMGWEPNEDTVLRFSRDATNALDTMDDNADEDDDALLLGIKIEIDRK